MSVISEFGFEAFMMMAYERHTIRKFVVISACFLQELQHYGYYDHHDGKVHRSLGRHCRWANSWACSWESKDWRAFVQDASKVNCT